jgi:hypothetical protein
MPTPATSPRPIRMFVAYAREDDAFRRELIDTLADWKRDNLIESIWSDREILPGEEWDHTIEVAFDSADLILILMSRKSIASEYMAGKEIVRALERHERGEARVVPMVVRSCDWRWLEGGVQMGNCPLCDQTAEVNLLDAGRVWKGQCERCGRLHIVVFAVNEARSLNKLHILSALFRRLPENVEPPLVTQQRLREYLSLVPDYSPVEKADHLLLEAARRTPTPGHASGFVRDRDYPFIVATGRGEIEFYLTQLFRQGYLSIDPERNASIVLSLPGWQRIEELRRRGVESRRAFVAMWFDSQMDSVYKTGIEPAIRDAGYEPLRIDRVEHVNSIDDEIVAGLRGSRFMVADFTGNRGGVYFEAGFMQGLGRNVFWVCKKEDLPIVHFDVRQFNFIDYTDSTDLRQRLKLRILAVEGQG